MYNKNLIATANYNAHIYACMHALAAVRTPRKRSIYIKYLLHAYHALLIGIYRPRSFGKAIFLSINSICSDSEPSPYMRDRYMRLCSICMQRILKLIDLSWFNIYCVHALHRFVHERSNGTNARTCTENRKKTGSRPRKII